MGLFDIQDGGRLGVAIQRILRTQGRIRLSADDVLINTITVADLSACTEPPVCRSAAANGFQAGVVAERGIFLFRCPAGQIALIKSFQLRPETNGQVSFLHGRSLLPFTGENVKDSAFVDQRVRQPFTSADQRPGCVLLGGTDAAQLASPFYALQALATGTFFFPNKWVVGNGSQQGELQIQSFGATNEFFNCVIEWDEYQVV